MKHIGDKLRKARKDKALRMIDVQEKIKVSTATLTAIETGKNKNFKLQTLLKLAELYGKNVVITLEANNEQEKESIWISQNSKKGNIITDKRGLNENTWIK